MALTSPKSKRKRPRPSGNGRVQRGRPSTYHPAMCKEVEQLCRRGFTDTEIAQFYGVSPPTIWAWKARYPEFGKALQRSKDEFDDIVVRKHGERAIGYDYQAVKIFLPAGSRKPVIVPYVEHVPPDVGAQKSWLHNRKPTDWRERGGDSSGGAGSPEPLVESRRQQVLDEVFKMLNERVQERLAQQRQQPMITINPAGKKV